METESRNRAREIEWACCGRKNSGLKNVHILISWTYDCVTTCSKGNFEDVIKLWILKWGNYLDYLLGLSVILKVVDWKEEVGKMGFRGVKVRTMWLLAGKGRPPETGKAGRPGLPESPPKEPGLPTSWFLAREIHSGFLTSRTWRQWIF